MTLTTSRTHSMYCLILSMALAGCGSSGGDGTDPATMAAAQGADATDSADPVALSDATLSDAELEEKHRRGRTPRSTTLAAAPTAVAAPAPAPAASPARRHPPGRQPDRHRRSPTPVASPTR